MSSCMVYGGGGGGGDDGGGGGSFGEWLTLFSDTNPCSDANTPLNLI